MDSSDEFTRWVLTRNARDGRGPLPALGRAKRGSTLTDTADTVRDVSNFPENRFSWGHTELGGGFAVAADGTPRLVRLARPDSPGRADPEVALPLVELTALGH